MYKKQISKIRNLLFNLIKLLDIFWGIEYNYKNQIITMKKKNYVKYYRELTVGGKLVI